MEAPPDPCHVRINTGAWPGGAAAAGSAPLAGRRKMGLGACAVAAVAAATWLAASAACCAAASVANLRASSSTLHLLFNTEPSALDLANGVVEGLLARTYAKQGQPTSPHLFGPLPAPSSRVGRSGTVHFNKCVSTVLQTPSTLRFNLGLKLMELSRAVLAHDKQ